MSRGLGVLQVRIMQTLDNHDGRVPVRDIRFATGASSAALSRALRALAERGFVRRYGWSVYRTPDDPPSPQDNSRCVTLSVALTKCGLQRLKR